MSKIDDLNRLISSLEMNEKRYFKRFAGLHGDKGNSVYMRLFDKIEGGMDSLGKLPTGNSLSRQKNYLSKLIMKSARSYRSDLNELNKLRGTIQDIDYLTEKGLYSKALKLIRSAKQLALKYEQFNEFITLTGQQSQLMYMSGFDFLSEKDFKLNRKEEKEAIRKMEKIRNYNYILGKFNFIYKNKGLDITRSEQGILKDLAYHKQIELALQEGTFTGSVIACFVRGIYHHTIREYNECYYYMDLGVNLFKANPYFIEFKALQYIDFVSNLVVPSIILGKTSEAINYLGSMRNLNNLSSKEEQIVSNRYVKNVLFLHISAFNFLEGEQFIREEEKEISEVMERVQTDDLILIQYYHLITFFGVGKFRDALRYASEILNDSALNLREDIRDAIRLIELLIHVELGNIELIGHRVRSLVRYFSSKEKLYRFEEILLNFLRKEFPKLNTSKELMTAFVELRDELIASRKEGDMHHAESYFDYIAWLQSKIERRSFADVLRERHER